jgi:hypothetical protein
MKRTRRFYWGSAIFVLLCFVPAIPISVVPSIKLQVVDELGNPQPNMVIEQSWRHYTYQFIDDVSQVRSNDHGVAEFPERIEYFSFAQIALGQALKVVQFMNPHASFGPSSLFLPRGNVSGQAYFEPGHPLPTTMVVKR